MRVPSGENAGIIFSVASRVSLAIGSPSGNNFTYIWPVVVKLPGPG